MVSHSPPSIQTPALSGLPETRRELLDYLKRNGEASTDTLSEITHITPSGARQHLTAMAGAALAKSNVSRRQATPSSRATTAS